jgi:hypothetical protein
LRPQAAPISRLRLPLIRCHGEVTTMVVILESPVIERTLTHLGLQPSASTDHIDRLHRAKPKPVVP